MSSLPGRARHSQVPVALTGPRRRLATSLLHWVGGARCGAAVLEVLSDHTPSPKASSGAAGPGSGPPADSAAVCPSQGPFLSSHRADLNPRHDADSVNANALLLIGGNGEEGGRALPSVPPPEPCWREAHVEPARKHGERGG